MRTLVVSLLALRAVSAAADEVILKSGGRVSGRIVSRTEAAIEVDVGAGKITVPTSSVVRVEEGRSALHEYEERASRTPAGDLQGWIALGEWASSQGLGAQAKEAYNRALAISPNDPRANAALGNVQLSGQWVSEDESYRARGFVRFEGEWITPAEHEAILRERAAEAQQERARQEAEARVNAAEAKAAEAEARAKKAEAEAADQSWNEGIPFWYGWGAGPVRWPNAPVVMNPIVRTR